MSEWTCLFTYGSDLKVYSKGKRRVAVNSHGKVVLDYSVDRDAELKAHS